MHQTQKRHCSRHGYSCDKDGYNDTQKITGSDGTLEILFVFRPEVLCHHHAKTARDPGNKPDHQKADGTGTPDGSESRQRNRLPDDDRIHHTVQLLKNVAY